MKRTRSFTLVCVIYVVLFAAIVLNGFAAEKTAFTIDDLYRLKGISGPALSPDGTQLLFSVSESCLKTAKTLSNIHRLDLKTGKQTQLTFSKKANYNPIWSEDGKWIYFLSSREEGGQLWVMAADGGEPRVITDVYTGVSSPTLNGKNHLYFTSTVFPECMADNDCNKKHTEKLADGSVQAHMADDLLYRHWTAYRDWQYTHLFQFDFTTKKVKAVTSGKMDYPTFSLAGNADYTVAPDGKTACIVSNHDKVPAHSTNTDLFLVDLNAPEFNPVNITGVNKGADAAPHFSPDGKWIAYLTQTVSGFESDRWRLALYDVKANAYKHLTETVNYSVGDFAWSKDSRTLYFTIEIEGYNQLCRVHLKDGKIEKLLSNHTIHSFQITPDEKRVIFTRTTVGEPVEIWSYSFGKPKSLQRLTEINREIADTVDIRPAEIHWTEGAAGKKIQVFVVKPHNFDPAKKYPLILNIHGGPQQMWHDGFRGDWQVYPGAGYVVAFANPHGSPGYGQEFCDAISKDWNGKVMEDINNVASYLGKLPFVDSQRMGAMGWSWGGYAVMWLEGHNKHFKALAAMMGIYDARGFYSATEELWFPMWDFGKKPWEDRKMYREISPSSYVTDFKTPCLIITGERDYRVPYTQSLEFFTDLREMNVPARLIVFKNDGHWPNHIKSMPVYYNAHLEWFHKYLNGGKAPYCTEKMIRNLAFDNDEKDEKADK